jgi:hypothetical protein
MPLVKKLIRYCMGAPDSFGPSCLVTYKKSDGQPSRAIVSVPPEELLGLLTHRWNAGDAYICMRVLTAGEHFKLMISSRYV